MKYILLQKEIVCFFHHVLVQPYHVTTWWFRPFLWFIALKWIYRLSIKFNGFMDKSIYHIWGTQAVVRRAAWRGLKLQLSSHVPSKHPKKRGRRALLWETLAFFKDAPKMCPEAYVTTILKTPWYKYGQLEPPFDLLVRQKEYFSIWFFAMQKYCQDYFHLHVQYLI